MPPPRNPIRATDNSKRTGGSMTTYIMLAHWTDRGMQAVADGPKRMDQAKKMLEDMGGRMQSLYLTMGQYDLVGIFDAPDDAIVAMSKVLDVRPGKTDHAI